MSGIGVSVSIKCQMSARSTARPPQPHLSSAGAKAPFAHSAPAHSQSAPSSCGRDHVKGRPRLDRQASDRACEEDAVIVRALCVWWAVAMAVGRDLPPSPQRGEEGIDQ